MCTVFDTGIWLCSDSAGTVIPNVVVDAQVSQADGGLMAPDGSVMDAVVEPELGTPDAEILRSLYRADS